MYKIIFKHGTLSNKISVIANIFFNLINLALGVTICVSWFLYVSKLYNFTDMQWLQLVYYTAWSVFWIPFSAIMLDRLLDLDGVYDGILKKLKEDTLQG